MIELLLALASGPAVVQEAPATPLKVVNTAFMVSGLEAPFIGSIRVVVQNTGTEADELIAVVTPLGETMGFRTDGDIFSRQAPTTLPIALPPPGAQASYLPLVVRIPGLATNDYWTSGTTITLKFAKAGDINVTVRQVSPAP